jgi:hypothetical protein
MSCGQCDEHWHCACSKITTRGAVLLATGELVVLLAHADVHTLRHVCLVEHVLDSAGALHVSAGEGQQAGSAIVSPAST